MACAVFTTRAALDSFVQASCADAGLPRPGRRQSDDAVMPDNCWTACRYRVFVGTVTVQGKQQKIGLVRHIPVPDVNKYALSTVSDPVDNGDGSWNVTYQGTVYTVTLVDDPQSFTYMLPKPWSWTDTDGTVYTQA